METLRIVLLVLHLVGLAAVAYGVLSQVTRRDKKMTPAILHGAATQLVTGLAMVGVLEASDSAVDNVKIGIKLLVALVIVVLAYSQRRKPRVGPAVFWLVAALEVVNVVVALTR